MDAFVRQRLSSPMRLLLATAFFGVGVAPVLLTASLDLLSASTMNLFAFLFAAGAIGQDVSSGVLTLAFARPVRRREYVIARWLGAGVLATFCVLLQVLAAAGAVMLRHGDLTANLLALKFLGGMLGVFGLSAVILMFSSLVPGLGDLGLYLLAMIIQAVTSGVGYGKQIGWLTRVGEEMERFLGAALDPSPWLGRGTVSWFAITSYLSTITICLVVAIWAVNRKELSYASG
jgi:ABC-type transport system involved in multi-copper enzyme maturation permease subunit